MIPFDLETWRANPDCGVYETDNGKKIVNVDIFNIEGRYILVGEYENGKEIINYTRDLMLKLPAPKPRPNADVIRAYANGLDVYYFDELAKQWINYEYNQLSPLIGSVDYKWHIGNPDENS